MTAGLSNKYFEFGQVYWYDDSKLVFPDEELIGERDIHDRRPVLIIQDSHYNNNPTLKVISVAPISSKGKFKSRLDYELKASIEPVKEDSFVRLYLIQPVLKIGLTGYEGKISDKAMSEIKAMVSFFYGLLS